MTDTDWVAVGRKAFEDGEGRAPVLSAAVNEAIAAARPGVGDPWAMRLMREFTRGWDAANMAADIPAPFVLE